MTKPSSLQRFADESQDAEMRIIRAIGSVGPRNIAELSRLTKVHQETVRYKIKKRFKKLGFRFQAEVDYTRLGLKLYAGTLRFSKPYQGEAPKFLRALNQSGYLTHFSKMIPQGHYNAIFSLPRRVPASLPKILKGLQENGLLEGFRIEEILVERHKQMDPTFFDFGSGRWEVEWNRLDSEPGSSLPLTSGEPAEFDYTDLLIIKELQINAMEHVVPMAKRLKLHPKTLEYHYRRHVVKRKLVPSYRVRWMQDIEKTLAHSVAFTRMTFRALEREEFARIQKAVSRLPFLWAEDVLKDGTYIATINIPLADVIATNSYLSRQVPGLGSRVEIGYLDPSESSNFTVPYNLFVDGEWTFDAQKLENEIYEAVRRAEK